MYVVEYLASLGKTVAGIDGSPSAIADNRMPDRVVQHDFTEGPYVPDKVYDVVWSAEFVEHVAEEYRDNYLAAFKAGKQLCMTYAAPGQGGYHHVNEQPEEYWVEWLASEGFLFDPYVSSNLRILVPEGQGRHVRDRLLCFVNQEIKAR